MTTGEEGVVGLVRVSVLVVEPSLMSCAFAILRSELVGVTCFDFLGAEVGALDWRVNKNERGANIVIPVNLGVYGCTRFQGEMLLVLDSSWRVRMQHNMLIFELDSVV